MSPLCGFFTLTQNLIADLPSDYYFAVTWSLTIEEWFYLLFGAALICCPAGLAVHAPCCAALRSSCLRRWPCAWLTFERGPLVFFRIDEIAYGVLMARLFLDRNWLFRHPWAPLAAGHFADYGVHVLGPAGSSRSGGAPDVQCRGHRRRPLPARRIAADAGCRPGLNGRCAGLPPDPMRFTSFTSRSWWMSWNVHWFMPNLLPASICVILAIVLPFPLAALSYRFLEAPLLRRRPAQDQANDLKARAAVAGRRHRHRLSNAPFDYQRVQPVRPLAAAGRMCAKRTTPVPTAIGPCQSVAGAGRPFHAGATVV